MAKRAVTTTKEYLVNAPLPVATESYTVISHQMVIDQTLELLTNSGLEIERELYRCNQNALVAQGIYHIKDEQDPEMSMMFAWSNSYDKSMQFKCAIGGYVIVCMNGVVAGDHSSYGRKHTGVADQDVIKQMSTQINGAHQYYTQLISDKKCMKDVIVSETTQAQLLGMMFVNKEIINMEQLSIIKSQMSKPSYDYGASKNSLWSFYNHITYSLKRSHPRHWLDQQKQTHWFLCNEFGVGNYGAKVLSEIQPEVKSTSIVLENSGQLDLLIEIAKAEEKSPVIDSPEEKISFEL